MKKLFSKEALLVDTKPHSWEDAIRITGGLLLNAGSIEEGYIQAMIDAIHQLGPYIVVMPHIAIAHAAPAAHVIKDDMVLVVFKEPILFNSENDPVHLMIGMCATAPHNHLDQFTSLAEIFDDDVIWERFHACNTVDQLYDLINSIS